MEHRSSPAFVVDVTTRYLDDQSEPANGRFVFAYTIRISNAGDVAAQLIARRWVITDANGKVERIEGEGVIGEQPWLRPGEAFEYTSGTMLQTDLGTMEGSYAMVADDGTAFDVAIPSFTLTVPRTLH